MTLALLVAAAVAAPTEPRRPNAEGDRVLLRTIGGDIVLGLYPGAAPEHVARLLRLARLGAYDSTHFDVVVPGMHARLSPVSERALRLDPAVEGALEPPPDEYTGMRPLRGHLFLARDPNRPDESKTAFSILLGDGPDRPGRYTVFGHVESGMEVVDGFAAVPRDRRGRPVVRLEVLAAEVVAPAELARRRLAPARTVAQAAASELRAARFALAVLTVLAAIGWFFRTRLPRAAGSLSLIAVFIGVFMLVTLAGPSAPLDSFGASALFLALLGAIKLMSRFESPE
ncbi:MAG: peptidylprolyl isomerase [Elusimicrobia bacterium]|nr:peptidylprolyl isomerase [Elusimicrobiota bacterium]